MSYNVIHRPWDCILCFPREGTLGHLAFSPIAQLCLDYHCFVFPCLHLLCLPRRQSQATEVWTILGKSREMQGRQGKSREGKAEQGKARECPETVGKAEAEEGQSSDGRGARESSARKCQGGKGQQVKGGNGSTRQCKARTEGLHRQGKTKERKARQ